MFAFQSNVLLGLDRQGLYALKRCLFIYPGRGRKTTNKVIIWRIKVRKAKQIHSGDHCPSTYQAPSYTDSSRGVQPTAQHKIVNLLKTFFAHQFSLEFVYLLCGPRQLFFFQRGPETPIGWTALPLEYLPGGSSEPMSWGVRGKCPSSW